VIYTENRAETSNWNPDMIDSGITLQIPVLAGSVSNPSEADLLLKSKGYHQVADDYLKLGNLRAATYEKVAVQLSNK